MTVILGRSHCGGQTDLSGRLGGRAVAAAVFCFCRKWRLDFLNPNSAARLVRILTQIRSEVP